MHCRFVAGLVYIQEYFGKNLLNRKNLKIWVQVVYLLKQRHPFLVTKKYSKLFALSKYVKAGMQIYAFTKAGDNMESSP